MNAALRIFFQFIISYAVLYAVIWMHEAGHGLFYWKYGFKKNPFHVTVHPTLFFSTPAPLDGERETETTDKEDILIGYGGILVNALCVLVMIPVLRFIQIVNPYMELILWSFMTLHFAEIVSYLFFGNLYLVSDMLSLALTRPFLRRVNLAAGIVLGFIYIAVLPAVPAEIFPCVLVFNILTVVCMSAGRFIFTRRANQKK